MSLSESAIRKQSESAYNQWAVQWREHASIHSKYAMAPMDDFENIGIGKAVLCVANGYSLELEMETIKAKQANVDILACDKTLGHLIENGIKPTYVMVCDANVDYERYLKPYENQLQDTILFINVCGNPKWTENGNWKAKYFFVNKDVLQSEKEFVSISGCKNLIPAGTNVSNAMVVLLTQSDNEAGRRNFFGYDKILLIGYDYCWREDGNYYAYNRDGDGKANYMRHVYTRNIRGDYAYTSNNLAFSAVWLDKYISVFRLPVIQCSRESIFLTKGMGTLSEQMDYTYKAEDSQKVRAATRRLRQLQAETVALQKGLQAISFDHYVGVASSI